MPETITRSIVLLPSEKARASSRRADERVEFEHGLLLICVDGLLHHRAQKTGEVRTWTARVRSSLSRRDVDALDRGPDLELRPRPADVRDLIVRAIVRVCLDDAADAQQRGLHAEKRLTANLHERRLNFALSLDDDLLAGDGCHYLCTNPTSATNASTPTSTTSAIASACVTTSGKSCRCHPARS